MADERGLRDLDEAINDATAVMDAIAKRITATKANNIDDLASKALTLAEIRGGLWTEDPADLDYDDHLLRDLIENICEMAQFPLRTFLSRKAA